MQHHNKQKGISLIELMIAMVVSLVLVAGVGTVYVSSKRNYQTRDQLSMMDETARVALNALTKHLEHAGYASRANAELEMEGGAFYVNGNPDPVEGSCGTVKSLALAAIKASATQDNFNVFGDAISIRFVSDNLLYTDALGYTIPGSCRMDCNFPLPTKSCPDDEKDPDDPNRWCLGDIVIDPSCPEDQKDKNGDCRKLPNCSRSNADDEKTFACQCSAGGFVPMARDSLIYNAMHVETDGQTRDSLGNFVPILYIVGSNRNVSKQPLVNGVENIQFQYGIDDNADEVADRYVNASNVANDEWRRVISIKVGILVRSLEPVLPVAEENKYQIFKEEDDTKLTFDDRFQRSVYRTVIHLRNTVDDLR